ncbi:MAG TPA: LytTR family DNA-binding domain-containing protein [Bacteroidales bacterium]|jgi:DNA-binding LytR/AlgR family response regulator|nr:LytTR family DNA-binding domain-containing protein [Bacteroidales bacterium]HRS17890.1 LytTR family DNA-binding domain-containing protein [Bacteroidales bacterium]
MKCVLVDDEPLARDVLQTYIEQVPYLQLIGICKNVFEASQYLSKESIDLLFLDIQMPEINGVAFAHSLQNAPMIIFTTAYSQYAIEGFDLQAVDYLLKPISPERFLKAVTKAYEIYMFKNQIHNQEINQDFMFVKSEYQTVKINFNDITYIEGLKDYVKIYCGKKMIVTLMNMKHIYEKLPKNLFIRVHKSYIIHIHAIEKIDRQRILIQSKYIPIGDVYKDEFEKKMGLIS